MKRTMLLLMSGVVVASLLGRVNPALAAEPKKFKPTITANPAVVTLEKGTGKTTLTYDGGKEHPYVEVWVSVNGADLTKVLEDEGDGKGTRTVTVQAGKKYRYVLTDFGKELASVEVKVVSTAPGNTTPAPKFKPTVTANPAVVTLPKAVTKGRTTLTYDGGKDHPNVEVWVSVNGADPTKVLEDEGDGKGTRTVGVEAGKKYRYILTDFGKELASVEVVTKTSDNTTPAPTPGNNTPATKPADLGAAIVSFAALRVGQKGLGDGECTRLIEQALAAAGAKPGKGYVWGRELKAGEAMQRGDIIQFTSCVFKDGAATWNLGIPNHTSIVEKASGAKVTLLHQNVDGTPATEKSRVRRLELDLASKVSGSYVVYRPEPK